MQKTSDIERVNDHVKAGHKEAKIAKIVGDSLACNERASENADKGHDGPAGSKSLEKGTRDDKAIVNLNGCSYSVVGDACRRLGWKITKDDDKWTLRWVDRYCLGQTLRDMRLVRPQRINHFPAMCEIAFKCRLAENLNRMRHKLPADYSFFPRTFVLPQYTRLARRLHSTKLPLQAFRFWDKARGGNGIASCKPVALFCRHQAVILWWQALLSNKLVAGVEGMGLWLGHLFFPNELKAGILTDPCRCDRNEGVSNTAQSVTGIK